MKCILVLLQGKSFPFGWDTKHTLDFRSNSWKEEMFAVY